MQPNDSMQTSDAVKSNKPMPSNNFTPSEDSLSDQEQSFIREAAQFFSDPGTMATSLAWISEPIEKLEQKLPAEVRQTIALASKSAVEKALVTAVNTMPDNVSTTSDADMDSQRSNWLHKGATTITGAVGGFFGFAALPLELPLTTIIVLRGILDQARVHGHDLTDVETRLEALTVFTMGTASPKDDSNESGYLAARVALASAVTSAASFLAGASSQPLTELIEKGAAPALVKLIAQVAKSFEIRVTQKLASDLVPVIGAISGSAMNYAFTDFYCRAANYHFGLRKLEKNYGEEVIQGLLKSRMNELAQPK